MGTVRSRRSVRSLLFCCAATAAWCAPLVAQSTSTLSVTLLPASAAAGGMGHAHPLTQGSADLLFYAPGLVGEASGIAATFSSAAETGALVAFAGAADWFGGAVALGVLNATYATSAGALARWEADLALQGPGTASETAVSVGYGREVGPVHAGVAARLLAVRAGGGSDRGAAFDVGAGIDLPFGTASVAVQDVGADLDLAGQAVELPTRVSLAAATDRRPVGPLDLMAAAALDVRRGGDVRPGGGVEVSYSPVQGRTFFARAGYGQPVGDDPASGWTLGAAFRGDRIGVDYAWGRVDDERTVHRVGLRWW